MKTEAELKNLAEKAAEFLEWACDGDWWGPSEDQANWLQEREYNKSKLTNQFFYPNYINNEAPILAHLALREMEKRGFWYSHAYTYNTDTKEIYHKWSFHKFVSDNWKAKNENEYIALWLAIEQTGEK